MIPLRTALLHLASTVAVVVMMPSCKRAPDAGMVEKIAMLEAELRDREAQLAAIEAEQKAQSEAPSSSSPAAPAAPDVDAARASYLAYVETLRSKLAAEMPEAKFDRVSVFPIEGPDPAKPIVSRVAFKIIQKDGRSGEMVVKLFADPAGSWQAVETSEVITAYKAKLTAAPVAATPPPQTTTQKSPAQPQRPQPTDVVGASRTVEVQWADDPSGNAPAPAPPPTQNQEQAQQPPTAPPQQQPPPATPKKVMPTSRDVIIDFE
jgi:hypothetical protein